MKKLILSLGLVIIPNLSAHVGFNCPHPQSLQCQVYSQDPNTFVCTSETVKVLDGNQALGDLQFYGPPMDIVEGFDFTKGKWSLVVGEYSYGFPDCVYEDKTSKTKMNFIYRPEDLREITPLETCKFSDGTAGLPQIICEK